MHVTQQKVEGSGATQIVRRQLFVLAKVPLGHKPP